MSDPAVCPRPLQLADASVLIGVLAELEGAVWNGLVPPSLARKLRHRLTRNGLLAENAGEREFRQALDDMNQRLRYAAGEYDKPPTPEPVPPDMDY